ncbi:MAG TPA: spermidine/putrescine ABC transporter substrate-binding protein [Symbiobacteriaceae bacterium]|nr:spermidine/putrescine ABC transporter substrate-binding protein [Symbiobacteriaceae bacterium]
MSRFVAAIMAALLLATSVVGCSGSGKQLKLFSWDSYYPDEVLQAFEKEFGAKIVYDKYPSNEDAIAKLRAGGAQYDIVVPSTYAVQMMVKEGLLQQVDMSKIPNIKNIDPEFMNQAHDPGNKYSAPYMWGTYGIAYNVKYVKTPPQKWEDLLNPEYKGRIVAVDDGREVMGIGLQALGHSRNVTDPAKLKAAQDWLTKLMPNIKAWDSDNPKAMLISGDAWLGLIWNGDGALAMQENPDIRYVLPKDGGGLWMDSFVIPKGAPNAELAHKFIDFMLRPEIGAKVGVAYPYGLANVEGKKLLPEAVRNNAASYPPKESLAKAEYVEDLGEAAALFDKAFTELKAGK